MIVLINLQVSLILILFFETLQDEEREDMKAQLIWMHKYINVLANRLRRQNVEPSKLLDK